LNQLKDVEKESFKEVNKLADKEERTNRTTRKLRTSDYNI
jgi:hypothetical protein